MIQSDTRQREKKRRAAKAGLGLLLGVACVLGTAIAASAHGYIGGKSSDIVGRAALKSNSGLGAVQYEPQSVEGPKGFPALGPADGVIASGGKPQFHELDEQTSTRWVKNTVTDRTVRVGWFYTASHATTKWHYYITKQGWDQNAPLTRAELEKIDEVPSTGTRPGNSDPAHVVTIPGDRSGYHVLLGVWDIADTGNAFYQVADLDVKARSYEDRSEKPLPPTGLQVTQQTDTTVGVSWEAPVGHSDKLTYAVERLDPTGGFHEVGTTSDTTFVDTGLTPSTEYRYHVIAIDGSGNRSDPTESLRVVTRSSDPAEIPKWDPLAAYVTGDVVMHNGHRYICIQSYQGNGDWNWINAPSLWSRLD